MNTEHGTLEKIDDATARLTFVRELSHPREKVWSAITEPGELAKWFPTTIEGDRAPGSPLKFVFPYPDAPVLEGAMLAYDPPSTIEFDWGGQDILRITLVEIDGGAGTRLTLTDTFGEYAKAARDAGGWHACLDNLAEVLIGKPARGDRWREVSKWYLENFPPDATTALIPDFADQE
ncbi:MAG: hypothetical protein QOI61_1133 [Actinomycetota bacterium]|jgi:uncharacterized protein YndB with AHSA1/START domain